MATQNNKDDEGEYSWRGRDHAFLKRKYGDEIAMILAQTNIDVLKNYLEKNIDKISNGSYVQNELQQLIKRYSPSTHLPPDMTLKTLITIVEGLFEDCERKLELFDVSLEGSQLLEGTALQAKIHESKQKISEYLKIYEDKLKVAEENVDHLHEIVEEDTRRIKTYQRVISELHKLIPDEAKLSYKEFFEEIQRHLESDAQLNSTFKEELAAEKRTKHSLLKEICRLQELRIEDQQQKMVEIAELAKDLELDEGIKVAILEKIKTFTSKPDEIQKGVNDWMKEINLCMDEKEEEIRQLKESVKDLDDRIVDERVKYTDTYDILNEILDEIMEAEAKIYEQNKVLKLKQLEVETLNQVIQGTDSKSISPTSPNFPSNIADRSIYSSPYPQKETFKGSLQLSPQLSPEFYGDSSKFEPPVISHDVHHFSPKSGIYQRKFVDNLSPGSGSFTGAARQTLLNREQEYFCNSSPMSVHTTPHSRVSSYSYTAPSSFKSPCPLMQSYGEKEAIIKTPRRAFSTPSHRVARDIVTIDPSTQNLNQVRNRINIGKSFNMRTVCQTSTPYHQNTRVESLLPESDGSGRMINYPLNIKHTAELTPTQYVTPFISKSRFGYTDPTARVLNIPPGDDIDIPTPFRTSGSLTSPKFIDRNTREQTKDISSVITFDSPPSVTPSSTRRYGLFTPKGIFRKKHFNVRRLYRPEEYQSPELPWSPQYLPHDSRSPIRSIPSTPVHTEKFISWEKSPDYSFGKSMMNRTFQASPIMDKTYTEPTSYAMSTTPTNIRLRNFDASTPYSRNRKFNTSALNSLNKTFDKTPPYTGKETVARSPSYMEDRTFSGSAPYLRDKTFAGSPPYLGDRTFAGSPPYLGDRTFAGSPPYLRDRMFAGSSPYLGDRTFAGSAPYLEDRTFSGSPTYLRERPFSGSPPYLGDRTFAGSPPYLGNRTFAGSPPYLGNRTFAGSPPYLGDRTFDGSPPHLGDRIFAGSSPYLGDRTFDGSPPH